jgi:adenylosuccinate synthase
MSLWVVVGGQFGSEGKGRVSACIVQQEGIDLCIRCGGPNSGHSFETDQNRRILLRQLPTAAYFEKTRLCLPAGALIDPNLLKTEIDEFNVSPQRLGIDVNAMIIEPADKSAEENLGLRTRLSSTLTGVGSALSRRLLRGTDVRLAKDVAKEFSWLEEYLTDVSQEANKFIDAGKKVLVEGTQGFGLSLYHSPFYPKTTSRDTSAAGFLSEVGLSPRMVSEIILVLRTFPIRVAGMQAGPLSDEISWEQLREESGSPNSLEEFTTVTQKLRRVGRFDHSLVQRAASFNRPTRIALNFLDHLSFRNYGVESWSDLEPRARSFVTDLEGRLGVPVAYCGTGPRLTHFINRFDKRRSVGLNEVAASRR